MTPLRDWLRQLQARGVTFAGDEAGRLHVRGRLSRDESRRVQAERAAIAVLLRDTAGHVESDTAPRRVVGQKVCLGVGLPRAKALYAGEVAAIPTNAAFHHRGDEQGR
jgi:hypothetical protein